MLGIMANSRKRVGFELVSWSTANPNSTSFSVTAPTDIQENDVLVLVIRTSGNYTLGATGFTFLRDQAGNGSRQRSRAFKKLATDSEPGTYTVTCSSNPIRAIVTIYCFRNADYAGVTHIGGNYGNYSTPGGGGALYPLITAATPGSVAVRISSAVANSVGNNATPPDGVLTGNNGTTTNRGCTAHNLNITGTLASHNVGTMGAWSDASGIAVMVPPA